MPKIRGIDHCGSAIGTIVSIGYDTVLPPGTLLCDGSSVSTTTYANLFAVLGYAWGGSGGNFNLPDFRGKFVRGRNHASGNDPDASSRTAQGAGGEAADAVGSIQSNQLLSHAHDVADAVETSGQNINAAYGFWGTGSSFSGYVATGAGATQLIQNTGGNETRPLNAYANYVVAYQ
jgi:microcystin-dependent protein